MTTGAPINAARASKVTDALVKNLNRICPNGVRRGLDLAKLSRWKVGGQADCIVIPESGAQVSALIQVLQGGDIPYVVLGSSTNILFADEGLSAVGIHIGAAMSRAAVREHEVEAEAGLFVPRFARIVSLAGLAGIEHICGIPGTLGGLICMNGGSQRRGIGEHITAVTAVAPDGRLTTYSTPECGFAYRTSVFQANGNIIVSARFSFPERDEPAAIRQRMSAILGSRRKKFPQKLPNCGSVFVSNPAMYELYGPPGAVIEKLGLKGKAIGGAQVSPLHANFIVNTGHARARDILKLVALVRDTVYEKTGYRMEPEAKYVDVNGRVLSLC